MTDAAVHDHIAKAVQFASQFGIRIAMDLDVRLAREAFAKAYPDELQEMLRIPEVALKGTGEVTLDIASEQSVGPLHVSVELRCAGGQAGPGVCVRAHRPGHQIRYRAGHHRTLYRQGRRQGSRGFDSV